MRRRAIATLAVLPLAVLALAALPLAVLALGGCGEEVSPEDQAARAARAERDVAMVERANRALPPLRPIAPEPITPADIERHAIFGAACTFAPTPSLGAPVIARGPDAWIKIGGEVQRLAADAGSRALPAGAHSLYDGREYALRLAIDGSGEAAGNGVGMTVYQGTIDLRDRWGRSVYTAAGLIRCGA